MSNIPNKSIEKTQYWRAVLACYDEDAVLSMVTEDKVHYRDGLGRYIIDQRELEEAACE